MGTRSEKSLRLFVVGATGGTGRELVRQALERNHRVTAFVRSPQKLGPPRDGLRVIEGDVLDADAVAAALAGHDAVLSAMGPPGPGRTTITSESARTTVTAMRASGVRRLLLVGVAVLFEDGGMMADLLRKTLLRNVADDSAAMERTGLDDRASAAADEWATDGTIRRAGRSPAGGCGRRGGQDQPRGCGGFSVDGSGAACASAARGGSGIHEEAAEVIERLPALLRSGHFDGDAVSSGQLGAIESAVGTLQECVCVV